MVIPKLPHCVADVVSFNNKAACFAGVGVNLSEVVDGVASHKLLPLIDRMILAYHSVEVKQFAAKKAERKWRYNGGFLSRLLSIDRAKFAKVKSWHAMCGGAQLLDRPNFDARSPPFMRNLGYF